MWTKWLPWRYIIRDLAKRHGFADPIEIVSAANRMAQPSEVAFPVELLRLAAVLHARGLINSQIIQNNLDWVWPYWVTRQFDPRNTSFIPRAFSLTHINLTHRNWTAIGIPGERAMSLVDGRGLVTPLEGGWSLDSWVIPESGASLLPSRAPEARQRLETADGLSVVTEVEDGACRLVSLAAMECGESGPVCAMRVAATAGVKGSLVISLRPFNPEGISFVHQVARLPDGWLVNGKDRVIFDWPCGRQLFSDYRRGDVFSGLSRPCAEAGARAVCDVGLCSAAAVFPLEPGERREVTVRIPLPGGRQAGKKRASASARWHEAAAPVTRLRIPDARVSSLYDAAVRTLILLSPDTVYAGPFTYKQLWIRDAVYALQAMLAVNLHDRARRCIDRFPALQTPTGYFKSQDGEWDSNGQVLWIMDRYCAFSGGSCPASWQGPIARGIAWIGRKRAANRSAGDAAGLFPAGFSAEHFGPSDHYYWDDLWGVAGLAAGERLLRRMRREDAATRCREERASFLRAIEESIARVRAKQGIAAVPSSPYRRMDSSAIGSLAASYPLRLFGPGDERMLATAGYLLDRHMLKGLFFHEIAHAGINIYLSLQLAQTLLRSGDARYIDIMTAAADAGSGAGQWPEAIHPWTGGGCMGDGQHLWAASEWIMMVRNLFVREEDDRLILGSGIPGAWLAEGGELSFGPAPTEFGAVTVRITPKGETARVDLEAFWHGEAPAVEVRLPGYAARGMEPGQASVETRRWGR